ncbi:PucR family transcriptional regulator [Rhodococcus opacus]|uniref:Putative CdaR family transcriptional regulator n=1 Tax=Rhodococcus opacus (strain B4) TaxID=632772 RepID=C1B2H1_RHOOB|nr:helix-turn-helix domain-containing protein [Rhodococcus opacus]BAH50595.1 putative CdaR family transcriptional regulator [Rhodococcus opacus B4]
MSEREIQPAIDEIANALGTGASLDDLTGRLVAYSVQHGHADDARVRALLNREVPEDIRAWEASHGTQTAVEPLIVQANPDLKMEARICVPLIHRGVRTGLLYVIDPLVPENPDRVAKTVDVIAPQVELLATVLYEMASPHLDERHQREVEFFAACQGDAGALRSVESWPAVRSASSLRLAVSLFTSGPNVTEVSEARAAQVRLASQQTVSRYPSVVAGSVQDTHSVVLLRPDNEANAALRLHQRLAAASGVGQPGDTHTERLFTGVTENIAAADELPEAYRRAVIAAQTAAVEPESGTIASWETIGPYRVIATRVLTDDGVVSELLATLIRGDSTGDLLDTLEVFYDQGDSVKAVADTLHLHRTSLYYRLNKIRDILGVDALNGATRLELHLALKARRWNRRPRI